MANGGRRQKQNKEDHPDTADSCTAAECVHSRDGGGSSRNGIDGYER